MALFDLRGEAEKCRAQANAFDGAERSLLLRIAEQFERMSRARRARRSAEETRCW